MKKNRLIKIVILSFLCLSCLVGCRDKNVVLEDVLSMKRTEDGKIPVTILVKYAFSINNFEKIIEEKFPDVDLIQVGNYTANTALGKETEARLEHDDLTDIVITWPFGVGEEYWQDRLINLAGMPFTSQYKSSMLDSMVNGNGELYFLPGPAQIRALVYNKTLFAENGWEVPNNYTEFLALCHEIEETGIRSYQLSLGNEEVLDTAFIGSTFGNAFSKPNDVAWMEDYKNGNGNFIDHFESALNTFQELIDEGIFRQEDLDLHYQDTQLNLFTRQCAMVEDSVLLTRMSDSFANTSDEFALMPFFNANPENDWARIYPTCYMGLNKHLLEEENAIKYQKTLDIMNYISTTEGQIALASDTEATYSSLKNMEAPNIKEIEYLIPALEEGRYGIFPALNTQGPALRNGLAGMVAGTMTASDVANGVDAEIKNKMPEEKSVVYGQATKDFTLSQTGAFVTDVIREEVKADIGLFLDNGKDGLSNAKGIAAKIYQGDITNVDLLRIFPDLRNQEQSKLCKIEMTGTNLLNTLEHSLEESGQTGWFYYFSGLKITFDPYASPGSRILSIQMENGDKIENDKVYSVAIMEKTVPDEYIISYEETGSYVFDILKENIVSHQTIAPVSDQRFIIKG